MPVSDQFADLLAQVFTYDLEFQGSFGVASVEAREKAYNGIGPDWLPKEIREWMTDRWHYFAPAAVIHDWDYCHPIMRNKADFHEANERFRRNCHKLLRKGVPWYKRWLYKIRVDELADACELFGFAGYIAAGRKA